MLNRLNYSGLFRKDADIVNHRRRKGAGIFLDEG